MPNALTSLSRDRLKEICRELGLDDSGRDKSALSSALLTGEIRVQPDEASP